MDEEIAAGMSRVMETKTLGSEGSAQSWSSAKSQLGFQDEGDYPIITMESVRVALRRLDFGERASAGRSVRNRFFVSGFRKETTRSPPGMTSKECWTCKGDHFIY